MNELLQNLTKWMNFMKQFYKIKQILWKMLQIEQNEWISWNNFTKSNKIHEKLSKNHKNNEGHL